MIELEMRIKTWTGFVRLDQFFVRMPTGGLVGYFWMGINTVTQRSCVTATSTEDLEKEILLFFWLYNNHLPQKCTGT